MSCLDENSLEIKIRQTQAVPYIIQGRERKVPDGLILRSVTEIRERMIKDATFDSDKNPAKKDFDTDEECDDVNTSAKQDQAQNFRNAAQASYGSLPACVETFEDIGEYGEQVYRYVTVTKNQARKVASSVGREAVYFADSSNYKYTPESTNPQPATIFDGDNQTSSAGGGCLPRVLNLGKPICGDFFDDVFPPLSPEMEDAARLREVIAVLTLSTRNIIYGLRSYHEQLCLDGTAGFYQSTSLNPDAEANVQACIEKSAVASALKRVGEVNAQQKDCIPDISNIQDGVYDSRAGGKRTSKSKCSSCEAATTTTTRVTPSFNIPIEGPA